MRISKIIAFSMLAMLTITYSTISSIEPASASVFAGGLATVSSAGVLPVVAFSAADANVGGGVAAIDNEDVSSDPDPDPDPADDSSNGITANEVAGMEARIKDLQEENSAMAESLKALTAQLEEHENSSNDDDVSDQNKKTPMELLDEAWKIAQGDKYRRNNYLLNIMAGWANVRGQCSDLQGRLEAKMDRRAEQASGDTEG